MFEVEKKLSYKVALRRWWKCFKETKEFLGWRYAVRTEIRDIWGVRQLEDFIWAIHYRTYEKYHVVKTDLKPGYYDIDTRLVHANFSLLCEYVEKEKPFEHINWDSDDTHRQVAVEIKDLYKWWKEVYPNYDKHDPLNAPDVKYPERESIPHQLDDDGDPITYEWKIKAGQEEIDKKFSETCAASNEYEKKKEEEIENNLIRLIKIRHYLWT
jgi:hypothetical protein